jgi:acetyl-CoA carboxylase biotin carboxyl carrier protein
MVRERMERGANETSPTPSPGGLSIAEIRQLITLINGSDIEEITIEQEHEGLKLTLRKPAPVAWADLGSDDGDDDDVESLDGLMPEREEERQQAVLAQLVGVFRLSMNPGSRPLVQVGDVVRQGQVVAAIEALNVLNEIEVESDGRVSEILVSDGQPVEYGQPLLVLEPLTA